MCFGLVRFYLSQPLSHFECYEPQSFELSVHPEVVVDVGGNHADGF